MPFNTLEQLASQHLNNVPTGALGHKSEYVELPVSEVEKLRVSTEYQRMISASNLKKQGQLNWSFFHPLIVSVRPDHLGEAASGRWVIDGQHKGVKYLQSGTEEHCPCLFIYHDANATLDDCLRKEAQIFSALNTLRKKLNKLDEIRAGVVWKDPEALWVMEVMEALQLSTDKRSFGSSLPHARELTGFYQFWFLTQDYKNDLSRIFAGYTLWQQMYGSKTNVTNVEGTALRGITFISDFADTCLTNGRKKTFMTWLVQMLSKTYSQKTLIKQFTDRRSNQNMLYYVLDLYREYCRANGLAAQYCIGEETMKNAVANHPKFKDPRV